MMPECLSIWAKSPFNLGISHVGFETAAGGNQEVLVSDEQLLTGEHA